MTPTIGEPSANKNNPWLLLLIIVLSAVAAPASLFKVPPIMTNLMDSLQIGPTQAGLLFSIFALIGIFLAIPIGMLVTRYGLWISGIVALTALLAGSIIGAFSNNLTPLLFSRIIEGIGMAFLGTVGPAAVGTIFTPDQRGKAMGLFTSYMSIGQILMFNLAPRIVVPRGWKGVWWFAALYSAVMLISWLLFLRSIHNPVSVTENRESNSSLSIVLKNKSIWLVTVAFCLFMISFQGVLAFMPTYLSQIRSMDLTEANALTSLIPLIAVPASFLGGALSDRMGSRRWPIVVSLAIGSIVYYLIPRVPSQSFLAIIILLGVFPCGIVPPLCFSAVTEVIDNPAVTGLSIAVISLGQNVGLFLSSTVFGFILENAGWNSAFFWMLPISLSGMAAMYMNKSVR